MFAVLCVNARLIHFMLSFTFGVITSSGGTDGKKRLPRGAASDCKSWNNKHKSQDARTTQADCLYDKNQK